MQKLRLQVVEAEAVDAEAIQKLSLPHPCFQPFQRPPYPKGAFTLDTKQPKFDVIDNLRKVSTSRKFRERLLNFT